MGRRSSIARLDPRVREAVERLVREGRATIDEIVAAIDALGGRASRAAVGRYVKGAREQMERYREAQEVARVWVERFGESPQGDVGQLLSHMLKTVAFQVLADTGDEEGPGEAKEVALLARAIKDLATADKSLATREILIRREVAKQAADTAETVARKGGLTGETVAELRRAILGVAA